MFTEALKFAGTQAQNGTANLLNMGRVERVCSSLTGITTIRLFLLCDAGSTPASLMIFDGA